MVCTQWEVGTQKIYTYPKESEGIYGKNGGDEEGGSEAKVVEVGVSG
jgi:hypothetical protein